MPALPGATAGLATGYLQQSELVGMLELFWEEYFNGRPLLRLFKERVRRSRQFIIKQFINLLSVGSLTARPESGKRLDPTMMAPLFVEPHFDQYAIDLESDQFLALANPTNDNLFAIDATEDALTRLRADFSAHIETYTRTLHYYIARVLSSPGGATINISGEPDLINWGFETADFSSDWATSTTNIQTEFAAMKAKFRARSRGKDPNLVIVNHNFVRAFVTGNDTLRDDFLPRNNSVMEDWLRALSLPQDNSDRGGNMQVVYVSDGYIDETTSSATGTADDIKDQWPLNIMTLAYVDPNDENFILNTVRTLDNDFKGGPSVDLYMKHAPKRAHLYFSGNYVPSWSDPTKVMICKVSATTAISYPADV